MSIQINNPLTEAIQTHQPDSLRHLVKSYPALVNQYDHNKETPLHVATRLASDAEKKGNVADSEKYHTYAHYLVMKGGADVEMPNGNGETVARADQITAASTGLDNAVSQTLEEFSIDSNIAQKVLNGGLENSVNDQTLSPTAMEAILENAPTQQGGGRRKKRSADSEGLSQILSETVDTEFSIADSFNELNFDHAEFEGGSYVDVDDFNRFVSDKLDIGIKSAEKKGKVYLNKAKRQLNESYVTESVINKAKAFVRRDA